MKLIATGELQNAESQGGMGPEGLLEAGQCSCAMKNEQGSPNRAKYGVSVD